MREITFLVNNYNPRFLKRINFFKDEGYRIHLLYFHRSHSSSDSELFFELADNKLCLGKLGNKTLFTNFWVILLSLGKIGKFSRAHRSSILYFFEMSSIGHLLFLGFFYNRKSRMFLEVGDLLHLEYNFLIEKIFNFLVRIAVNKIELFISTSEGFLDYFESNNICFKNRLVIENKPLSIGDKVLDHTFFDGNDFRIGYVGRFRYYKVVRAFIEMLGPKETFLFYGFSTKSVFESLFKINAVEYCGPFRKQDGLVTIYGSFHAIYCLYKGPNEKYLSPNKLWEGIAYLTPVIINKDSYYAPFVKKYNLGIVLDTNDPDSYRAGLDDLKLKYASICSSILAFRESIDTCFDDTKVLFDNYFRSQSSV